MTTQHALPAAAGAFTPRNGLAYGLLGLPLAFVALPLYVILPNHYAREFGVPLALLGAILLDRKSTRLNSSHIQKSRMPSSA